MRYYVVINLVYLNCSYSVKSCHACVVISCVRVCVSLFKYVFFLVFFTLMCVYFAYRSNLPLVLIVHILDEGFFISFYRFYYLALFYTCSEVRFFLLITLLIDSKINLSSY